MALSSPVSQSPPHRAHRPPTVDDGWATAAPGDVGLDAAPLERLTEAIRRYPDWNVHAVLVERDGRLVYEEYFSGEDNRWGEKLGRVTFDRQTRHDLRSVTKSVVSALVGMALASGAIPSLDQPIVDVFPECGDLATPERRRITLRHALTMSAGLQWNEELPYTDARNDEIAMTVSGAAIRYVLSRPIVAEPGASWNYNGGLTQLLAAVVQRSAGQPFRDHARTALFAPLGIDDVEWVGDLGGLPAAASGLRLRPRDLAKFGSLYLHSGRWGERQIVPAAWVSESTRWHLAVRYPVNAFGTVGYGYHWWHNGLQTGWGTIASPVAAGNGQQRIYILPDDLLVVTVLAGRYDDMTALGLPTRLLVEYIIPAARGEGAKANTPA